MRELVFLGGCPVVKPEGIYLEGRRVIRLGMSGSGALGDVGDLFAYRQEWEPFISAHLELWRDMNSRFENSEFSKLCPAGIFTNDKIPNTLDDTSRSFCASLSLTRMMTSSTDDRGILPRWNAWQNKSSSDIVVGAAQMLKWHQDVVLNVGGPDKDRLVDVAKQWDIKIKLPDLPSFSTQQEVIARIQGAYTATKGILQIIGYGTGETLETAGDVTLATAAGLKDTAQTFPSIAKWAGIAAAVTAVVVGGVLIVYYVPRRREEPTYARP